MELSELSELLVKSFNERNTQKYFDLLWEYSRPRKRPAPRAFLLTINGLTYSVHKEHCFAGVPYPSEVSCRGGRLIFNLQRSRRSYSMLAYLMSIREGDLIFFFQADPQYPENLDNRRGFRGIWASASKPFIDTTAIKSSSTGYEVLGACPNCGKPFDFGGGDAFTKGKERKCLWCNKPFGLVKLSGGERNFSKVIISLRLLINPVVVFKRTAGDNRVYSDLGKPPLVWVSRADNAMGPGKGSSIRVLLPEEMAKIGYMLATEDAQRIETVSAKGYPGKVGRITDYNGQPIEYMRSTNGITLQHELMLNLYFALNIDRPHHPLVNLLKINLSEIEYWSSEFPWGYTGDTADFVLTLWNEKYGRYIIYIFEFKRDNIDVNALAEILLYTPWVSQVLLQFREETKKVTVRPVLVGHKILLNKKPEKYLIHIETITGIKEVEVESPLLLAYSLHDVYPVVDVLTNETIYYAKNLKFDVVDLPTIAIKPPPPTYTTTSVEKRHVVKKYLANVK